MNILSNPTFHNPEKARTWLEARIWPDGPFRRVVKITSGKEGGRHGNGSIRLPFAMIAHVTHHGAMADGRIRLSGRAVGGGLDTGARLSAGGNAIINVMLRRELR